MTRFVDSDEDIPIQKPQRKILHAKNSIAFIFCCLELPTKLMFANPMLIDIKMHGRTEKDTLLE
jgi:hypothetical protein